MCCDRELNSPRGAQTCTLALYQAFNSVYAPLPRRRRLRPAVDLLTPTSPRIRCLQSQKSPTISISTQVPSGPELITRTLLVQRLQQSAPDLTSWTFRKAEQLGLIRPDRTGRFAGHAVHYYDPTRIPELIPQLRAIHRPAGTLVIHSHFGPGRILAVDPGDPNRRIVSFFANSARVSICAFELRRLVSANVMARHVGVNRKSFAKIAALRGILPTTVTPESSTMKGV